MIEPTDEQVVAFQRAWENENVRLGVGAESGYRPGDRTRAGLRAVLNLKAES